MDSMDPLVSMDSRLSRDSMLSMDGGADVKQRKNTKATYTQISIIVSYLQ